MSPLSVLPLPCLQSRLQTQLKALKAEMDQAKVRGMEMGLENRMLTGRLGRQGMSLREGEGAVPDPASTGQSI